MKTQKKATKYDPENIKMYIDTRGGFQDTLEAFYDKGLETVNIWHTYNGKDILVDMLHLEHEQTSEFITNYMKQYISNFY